MEIRNAKEVSTKKTIRGPGISNVFQKFGALIGLIMLSVFFSIATENFLSVNNILTIGLQTSIIAIVAMGQTFAIIKAGIDLSVGSIVGLTGIVTAQLMVSGMPIFLSIIIGLVVGVIAGLITGFIIAYGNLPPFIATLGMMGIARGVAFLLSDGKPISGLPREFGFFGGGTILNIPVPLIIMAILAIVVGLILSKSRFGRRVYAIGSNESAAYLSGINVKRTKLLVYSLSGLLSGVAGLILTSRLISAQPSAGTMYELDAIAAVVIGGASLMGGIGTVGGTIIGAFVMGVLRNGLNIMNISPFWQQIAIGIVIVAAVYVDNLRRKKAK